jgi:putative membrane protein
MMFWHSGGWSPGGIAIMAVVMIALLGLLAWAAYALVTGTSRRSGSDPGGRSGSAGELLDERLARGEIDAEEHRRLRGLIASGNAGAGGGR